MPTPSRGPRLGGSPNHERLILSNLAAQLFEHGRITTTVPKAKRLRPLAERLITKARRGDVHAHRQVAKVIRDKSVAHALFAEIAPRYANRPGGYTRITRIGARKGDNAPLAVIELVEELEQRRPSGRQAPAKKAAKKAAKAAEPAPEPAPEPESETEQGEAEEPAAEGPYGPGSAGVLEDGSAPEGYPVKGNVDSKKYHTPDGRWYEQTTAEVWFATPEDAERAGFAPAGGSQPAPDGDADDS